MRSVASFESACLEREARALHLASRYPESKEALVFYARIARLQSRAADGMEAATSRARSLALEIGPAPLREAARALDEGRLRAASERYLEGSDVSSPISFFARVLLQAGFRPPGNARKRSASKTLCPDCAQPPQAGSLRRSGDGTEARLVCSLCFQAWVFPRGRCASCGEADEAKLVHYQASEIPHVKLSACESCRCYLHYVDVSKEPSAVPEVDEMAALALDVWARERGYRKVFPNLVGI